MLRNSSALLLSFFIHMAIALAVVMLYTMYHEHVKEKEKSKPICLCLSQVKEVVVVPPPVKELPKPPEPKKIKPPKPVKKKIVKKVVKPKKRAVKKVIVVKKPVKKPVLTVVVVPPVVEEVVLAPTPVIPIKSVEEKYLEEHLKVIASLLKKNLYYPKRARKRRITGEVLMEFILLKNGDIGSVKVKKGSKDILNKAAIKTIKKLSGKVPKPSKTISIEIPIVFRLK